MGDAYVVVDLDDLPDGSAAKAFVAAVRCIRSNAFDPDFPDLRPIRCQGLRWALHAEGWWHKPGDLKHVARFLSRHGLTGRLSIEGWKNGEEAWGTRPKPVYKGFSAADPNSRSSKKRAVRRLAIKGGSGE
jgi:hypothetical protein